MAPEDYQVRWEYAEKGKSEQGWFEMYDCIAKQLEEVTTDNSVAEEPSELRLPDEDGVFWKFDLIEMTQRRLTDGNDENARCIRRILVCETRRRDRPLCLFSLFVYLFVLLSAMPMII